MGDTLVSKDPATGQELGSVSVSSAKAVEAAVEAAREAQTDWATTSLDDRLAVLQTFSDHLLEQRDEVARLITRESGKPVSEARLADLLPALEMVSFLGKHGKRALRDESFRLDNVLLKDRTSTLRREPYGVVGIIAPWNYPFSIPATQVLNALFTGNGVVFKPSEKTPLIGQRLVELLHEAGVPEDLVQLVQGPGQPTGEALVQAPPDLVVFTGSVPTGRSVAKALAGSLVPYTLELGGKDPMLVLDDAPVDLAARGAVWGAFTNAGQTCAAVERVYVHQAVAEPFIEAVVDETQALRVGPGHEDDVEVGPLIDEAAVKRCLDHLDDAVERGATVATGGQRLDELGPCFLAPTVLTGVEPTMTVAQDETFGPLLPIQVVEDDEEALALANASPYGLTASLWTRDRHRAEALANRLEAGTVTINDCIYTYAACRTPWSGINASGMGHTHGLAGLQAMTRTKHINRSRSGRARSPWYFPYDEDLARLSDDGLEFLYGSKLAGLKAAGPTLRRLRGPRDQEG